MQFGRFHKAVLVSVALAGTVVFATSVWSKSEKKADDVAALVNGEPISAKTVQGEVKAVLGRLQQQGHKPNETEMVSLRESVLDKIIKLELLSQESKKAGITVSSTDIGNEMNGYKKDFPDDKAFVKALGEAGITEAELRKQIGKNLAIQKLIDTRFKAKAQVAEQEVKNFYKSNPDKFTQPEMVRARHILIASKETEPKADRDRKRATLAKIRKQLKSGADFGELAKQSSDCPSKERGGDLGFFPKGQMVKPFDEAVFKMKTGELSDIVETEFGFHLIKLEEKKPAKTMGFDEAKAKITAFLTQEKVATSVEAFLSEAKNKATIKIMNPPPKK